jgi:hypothetical protein
MLYDINGDFRTTLPISKAERLVDFGDAVRVSLLKERPLRIRLSILRPAQPKAYVPMSGCSSPASITKTDMEAAVGITKGSGGVNRGRVNAARAKIEAFRVDRSALASLGSDTIPMFGDVAPESYGVD